eukprot:587660-Prymnesium_polylepis.1
MALTTAEQAALTAAFSSVAVEVREVEATVEATVEVREAEATVEAAGVWWLGRRRAQGAWWAAQGQPH